MNFIKLIRTRIPFVGLFCLLLCMSFYGKSATNVSGFQSGIWTKAKSPYIITGTVTIAAGHTLNIQPGVVVIFSVYNADIIVNGSLNAVGTATDSIRFKGTYSSYYNTAYGGSVYLNTSTSTIGYLRTDSLGYNNHAILIADLMTPTIANSTIKNNNRNLDLYGWIGAGKNFSNINGVMYVKAVSYSSDATMAKMGANGYYFLLGTVTINAGSRLTMQPGTVLLSPYNSADIVINGALDAQGTGSDSIRIRGKAYIPYNTFYGGTIYLNSDSSKLNYVSIDSMGSNTSSIVVADGVAPVITNTAIKNTGSNDIYTWIGGGKSFLNLKAIVLVKSQGISTNATVAKIGPNSFYKLNGTVTISDGSRLTIQAGAKIVFPYFSTSLVVNGLLIANGTATDSIRFMGSSYLPVSYSNYGGSVYLNKDSSVLNYVVIDSMGDNSNAAATLFMSSNSTVSNSTIKNGESIGILIADNLKPVVSNSVSKNHLGYDAYSWVGGYEIFSAFTGVATVKSGNLSSVGVMPKFANGATYSLAGALTVNDGARLIIKPGVTVLFPYFATSLIGNGIIDAQGTVSDSIRFLGRYNVSNSSSDHGGYIGLSKDSSILNYVVIDSMGDSYYYGASLLLSSKCTVSNTIVKNSETVGIYVSDNAVPVIAGTMVSNNVGYDLNSWVGGVKNLSSFTGNVNVRSGSISVNTTFPKYNNSNPYYNLLGAITVNAGVKFTVNPGVIIGFPYMATSLTVNGSLDAQGTISDSIRFVGKYNTSNPNSTHGGIIALNSDSSKLNYVVLDSMGDTYYYTAALYLGTAGSSVSNTSVRNTESSGIVIADNIQPSLSNVVVRRSGVYDLNCWFGGTKNFSNITGNVYIKSGNLGVNSTFPKLSGNGVYTLLGPVTINNGSRLTINPGVKLLFPNFSVNMSVNGVLDAQGTATDSIRIYGRNAPEYSSQSSHGGAIYFYKDSSILNYVSIDSMGDSYYYPGAVVVSDNVTTAITNTYVTRSESSDIYTWIGGGKFMDNIRGVITLRSYSITSSATLYRVRGSYYKMSGGITLDAPNTLTIQPGVTIVSPSGNVNFVFNGTLVAIGNKTDSIKFKGTRNLANSTLYGGAFYINRDSSILKYVVVDSLGETGGNYGALVFSGGCNLRYCTIKNNKNAGMYITSSKVNVSYSNITKNENGFIVYNSKPVFNNCNIFSNTNYGANNVYKVYSADATNCFWGTATGPFHPTLNPSGTGNAVSDSIQFVPFKTATIAPVLPDITSFNPASGATDTVITIKGTRFTSVTAVSFGSTPAKSFTVVNDSVITAKVNAGSSGFLKVTKSAGADSLAGFTYCAGIALTAGFDYSINYSDVIFNNTSAFATANSWDFGDATFSSDISPAHHYSNQGTYTACLTTFNACARSSSTICKTIPAVGFAFDDGDRDGLFDPTEAGLYGTSNTVFDSNGDGLADGINVFIGYAVLAADSDGDGISNLQEIIKGTNPLLKDSDFDGVPDNLDAFPLDRYRSKIPPPSPADNTAPIITLTEPF